MLDAPPDSCNTSDLATHAFIDLTSGSAAWDIASIRTTAVPPSRGGVNAGSWIGDGGWNPLLTASTQRQQPAPSCSGGQQLDPSGGQPFTAAFNLTASQQACFRMTLDVAGDANVTLNGVPLVASAAPHPDAQEAHQYYVSAPRPQLTL